jgi:hypothetical protein
LLLKRYSNIDYVLHLPIKRGINLLKKAMDEDTRDYAFKIYLAAYPNMDKKNFKTFNEFWEEAKPQNIVIDTRNEDEIMKEILAIENKFVKGGN